MNFKKAVLLGHIDAALKTHRDEYDKKVAAYEAKCAEEAVRWHAEIAPLWVTFADSIKRQLRRDQPITYEDVPTVPGQSVRDGYKLAHLVFSPDSAPGPYKAPPDLVALRRLVESCSDEVINTKALGAKRVLEILG